MLPITSTPKPFSYPLPGELSPRAIASPPVLSTTHHPKPLTATVRSINHAPLLKTWEIVICAITIIGLFVLLGIYYKRKRELEAIEEVIPTQEPEPATPIVVKTKAEKPAAVYMPLSTPSQPVSIAPAALPPPSLLLEVKLLDEKEKLLKTYSHLVPVFKQLYNVDLADQVWLLKLSELYIWDIDLPPAYAINKQAIDVMHCKRLLKLKSEIEKVLQEKTKFSLAGKCKSVCPSSLDLLPNLEELDLSYNLFNVPPDVSKLTKLKWLGLNSNTFLTCTPDLSTLTKLEVLSLENTPITTPPDLRANVRLKYLSIANAKLTSAPDLSQNVNLETLDLSGNLVSLRPDLSNNKKLKKPKL